MNRRMEPVLAVAPRLHCHRRPAPSTQPLPPRFCVLYSPWLARQDPSLPNLTEITRPAAVPGTYVRDTVEPPSPLPRTRADQEAPQASGCKNHPLALSGLRITTPMSVCVCGRWASFDTRDQRAVQYLAYIFLPHILPTACCPRCLKKLSSSDMPSRLCSSHGPPPATTSGWNIWLQVGGETGNREQLRTLASA